MPSQPKTTAPSTESFFRALVAASASSGPALSTMEQRLVTVATSLFKDMVIMVRCADHTRGTPYPLSVEVIQQASRMALVAAAEMESQLHQMRDATKSMDP